MSNRTKGIRVDPELIERVFNERYPEYRGNFSDADIVEMGLIDLLKTKGDKCEADNTQQQSES